MDVREAIRPMSTADHEELLRRQRVASDIQELRQAFQELKGLTEISPDLQQAMLLSLVKRVEDERRKAIEGAERMERQARASRQQAEGMSVLSSIVLKIVLEYREGARASIVEAEALERERQEQAPPVAQNGPVGAPEVRGDPEERENGRSAENPISEQPGAVTELLVGQKKKRRSRKRVSR